MRSKEKKLGGWVLRVSYEQRWGQSQITSSLFICTENKSEAKRRRTERVKREKINSAVNKDLENRKRSRSNSHSDHSRRGRGRPKSASAKKHEEERGMRTGEIFIGFSVSIKIFFTIIINKLLYHSLEWLG